MKYHYFGVLSIVLLVLGGCAGNTGLTSSFSSRKYTKGYFFNNSAVKPEVESRSLPKEAKTHIEPIAEEDTKLANIIMLTKSSKLISENKIIVNQILKEYKKQLPVLTKRPRLQEQTSQIPDAVNRVTEVPDAQNKQLTTAKVLISIGVFLLLLAIIGASSIGLQSFLAWIVILMAISFLVIGIENYIDASNPQAPGGLETEKPISNDIPKPNEATKGKETNYGGTSMGLAILGSVLGFFIGLLSAAGVATVSIANAYFLALPIAILLVALVFGIIGRNSPTEKHPGAALAGIIISGIFLALLGTLTYLILMPM